MYDFIWFIISTFGFLISVMIVLFIIRTKKKNLNEKFLKLGNLLGMSYGDIVLHCGAPETNMLRKDVNGNMLRECIWVDYDFKLVLYFNESYICIAIGQGSGGY